jgi:hypothetical protein
VGVFGTVSLFCVAIYSVSDFIHRRKIDKLTDELKEEKERPRVEIAITDRRLDIGRHSAHFRYSFTREPFIKPWILFNLNQSIWDKLPVNAGIDLEGAMESVAFTSLPVELTQETGEEFPWVKHHKYDEWGTKEKYDSDWTAYKFIGRSPSGVHVVHLHSADTITSFQTVLLLTFETTTYLVNNGRSIREAIILKPWGDFA